MMTLLQQIEAFLKAHSMSATAFGTKSLNDPPFVQQLRDGRDVKMSTVEKVQTFMREWPDVDTVTKADAA